jgi:hypothetical protein
MALETLNNRYGIRHFDEGGTVDDQVSDTTGALQNQGTVTVQGADSSFDNAQAIDQSAVNANTTASVNTGLDPTRPIKTGSTEAISNWYKTTLGRDPDQGGLAYWSGKFGDALTPDELAILNSSQEAQNRSFLTNLYDTELGRKYDQGGYDFWMNSLGSGTSKADIEKAFNASPEGSMYDIYQQELGRKPDTGGAQYWSGQNLTPEQLRQQIAQSEEGRKYDIAQAYESELGRKGSAEEIQNWYDQISKGTPFEDILKSIESSPEATVYDDYMEYLGRAPDAAGGKYWIEQLQAGVPPQDIARAIALSEEGINTTKTNLTALLGATLGTEFVAGMTPEQINQYARLFADPSSNVDQNARLADVYKQIALDPILGAKLKTENPTMWEQVTPLTERLDELVRTDRTVYGQYGTVDMSGAKVPILSAKRADEILGSGNSSTVTDFSHSRGNLANNLGWSSNSFSSDLSRGANALGVTSIVDPETGQTSYTGVNEAAALVGIDPTQFKDKQVAVTSTEQQDEFGNVIQAAGQPVYQRDSEGNVIYENGQPVPAMRTITAESQLYDAVSEAAKNIYRYTGDSLTSGRAVEGGAQSFDTVFYKRVGDELIPISKPVSHGGQQNMDVYRPKDYGFAYYAQGPAFVAAAALSFAMADPSLSLATAVGSALLPTAAATAIGTTATGIVGATVLGAAAGALSSTAGGADPGKGALTGAVTGLVASSMKPLLSSTSVASATKSIAEASQGVFSQAQVGNIIGATIASTLASAASGASGDQILNSFKTSLISSGLSEKAAQLAVAGVREAFGNDPKTLAQTAAATKLVTRTASTAALSGKNQEQIQAAVISTLVQNAANIAGAGTTKSATSGFTKAEIDAVNQGAQLANQSGQTQYYELASNITSDQPQPLVNKSDIEASLYDGKYWDPSSKSWIPMPASETGGGGSGLSQKVGAGTFSEVPTAAELKNAFEKNALPSAADVNQLLASGGLSKDAAEAYLKAIVDFQKPVVDFSKADDSLNLGISLAVGLIGNGASPQNTINNVSKAVGIDPRIILKAINNNSGVTTKTGNVTTTTGTSTTGTSNTVGTSNTTGTSTTGTTGTGTSTTGTDGTGAGTQGTGTGSSGEGTGGGGGGDINIGVGGTGTGTGTGGKGTGTGTGTGTGGGGGGGTGIAGGNRGVISPFLMQEYGGIQNLAPGLTGGGNYSLSGIPSTNTNMNPMIPNAPLQQFAATSPVSPLALGNPQQQPQGPMQLADGGSTTQKAYNPYDVSSGISGSLTPGLTKAKLDYLLTGLPQNKAEGGPIEGHNPQFFSEGGLGSMDNTFVQGDGDGTSDQVPAMLANGEFVIPADVVSGLGNGSNDAGAEVLQEFLKVIREHKHSANSDKLPPKSKGALAYLTNAKRKVKVA